MVPLNTSASMPNPSLRMAAGAVVRTACSTGPSSVVTAIAAKSGSRLCISRRIGLASVRGSLAARMCNVIGSEDPSARPVDRTSARSRGAGGAYFMSFTTPTTSARGIPVQRGDGAFADGSSPARTSREPFVDDHDWPRRLVRLARRTRAHAQAEPRARGSTRADDMVSISTLRGSPVEPRPRWTARRQRHCSGERYALNSGTMLTALRACPARIPACGSSRSRRPSDREISAAHRRRETRDRPSSSFAGSAPARRH